MDQGDAQDLMQLARGALGLGKSAKRFPKKETLHYLYSRHINTELPLDELLHREFAAVPGVRAADRRVVRRLHAEEAGAQSRRLRRPPALLGDDARGVARPRRADVRPLRPRARRRVPGHQPAAGAHPSRHVRDHRKLTVVGDDAQSIYSFRGAHFRNILDFPRQYPGTTLVTLAQNYRSTQPILALSNILISRAEERFTKDLWTAREGRREALARHGEGRGAADAVRRGPRAPAARRRDAAARDGRALPRGLHVGRSRDRAHQPEDPVREVGRPQVPRGGAREGRPRVPARQRQPARRGELVSHPHAHAGHRRRDRARADGLDGGALLGSGRVHAPHRSAEGARRAPLARAAAASAAGRRQWRRRRRRCPRRERHHGGARALRRHPQGEVRPARSPPGRPRSARTIAAGYPSRGASSPRSRSIRRRARRISPAAASRSRDALVLSTVHSAKGKEWKAVFLIWAVDGWFPSSRAADDPDALEEERRLMYVALTRAKTSWPSSIRCRSYGSRRGADYSIDQLSRFLDRGVRATMQRVVVEEPGDVPPPEAPAGPAIDLRAIMRGRFGK